MMPLVDWDGLESHYKAHDRGKLPPYSHHASLPRAAQAAQLRRLALYFDVGAALWRPKATWAAMPLADWDGLFQPGIAEGPSAGAPSQPQTAVGEPPGETTVAPEQGRAEEQRPTEEQRPNEESSPVMQAWPELLVPGHP